MTPRILITGGAGFIGMNAVDFFNARNWRVTVFDNLSRRGVTHNIHTLQKRYGDRLRFIKGDVRFDQEVLDRECAQTDAVLHLAAQVAVTTSVVNPREDFEINALGTLNVLEAVRAAETPPIVLYASTNKVYGDLGALSVVERKTRYELKDFFEGVSEAQQLDFHSPYGCSKGTGDEYVRDYARIYGIPTVVFRQSCIYGPNQFGLEDQGWLAWFTIAAKLERPITVFGTGKQVRDVLHVDDLLSLYLAAIEQIRTARGQVYNTGGGADNTFSLLEFFSALEDTHDLPISYEHAEVRQGDQKVFVSDNTKARSELSWEPQVSHHDGLNELVSWVDSALPHIRSLY